jgi:hypothetical protein
MKIQNLPLLTDGSPEDQWLQMIVRFWNDTDQGTRPFTGPISILGNLTVGGNLIVTGSSTFGTIIASIFQSASANPAQSGVLRLANVDAIVWRNNTNTGDLSLLVNGGNQLQSNTPFIILPTSNQLALGGASSSNVITLTAPTPTASRTYTIIDAGANANFVMSEGTATINGVKTFAGELIGKGTATNDSAASGFIGEYVSSNVAVSTVSLTAGTAANVTSISLTAGDWDVGGNVVFSPSGTTTVTDLQTSISTTSATQGGLTVRSGWAGTATTPGDLWGIATPGQRISIASTTTVYLVAFASFGVSTLTAGGTLWARRAR